MARKNTRSQAQEQGSKKIGVTKKEMKNKKMEQKKGKKQQIDDQQIDEDEQQGNNEELSSQNSNKQSQEKDQESQENSGQSSDQQQSSEQQSSSQLAPQNYAVKQMNFRERRGTKMNYLMNRKKQQEEDPFWQNQGQNFFGDLEDEEADEDYQQSSSGRDQFDSDFGQTESEHNDKEPKIQEPEVDEEKAKEKKKQQELMLRIGARATKKQAPKTVASVKKPQTQKKPIPQVANRYIHQVCTQQQLLGEAAQTEYINWLSLQKLISLENQKKDFAHKEHFLDGSKVIFRDRINEDGKRATSYELVGLEINKISDLTEILNRQGQSQ